MMADAHRTPGGQRRGEVAVRWNRKAIAHLVLEVWLLGPGAEDDRPIGPVEPQDSRPAGAEQPSRFKRDQLVEATGRLPADHRGGDPAHGALLGGEPLSL